MDLQRIGLKLFVESPFELADLIPVFHRWIQTSAVDGMLIDVADYSHVHHGPGIMLIAHEGNYSADLLRGRLGLMYWRKQPLSGTLPERLAEICRILLSACERLEEAPELGGRIQFRGQDLLLVANDRLLAPNSEETMTALSPPIRGLLDRLYDGADYTIERERDPRELFMVNIKSARPVSVGTLLSRVGRPA